MWTIDRIDQYIKEGLEENLHLDYKGAGSILNKPEKKKEISKDVSAFANSDGGTLIYGVAEFTESGKKHLPEKIDPINGNEFTKEWLEQVINSSISPRINNITITPIQTKSIDENLVIYVVEIPKGNTAHQAKDKRYYRRYNFESIMMEDWEIKDIINRPQHPSIELEFELSSRADSLNIYAINSGNSYAMYVNAYIKVPNICLLNHDQQNIRDASTEIFMDNTRRDLIDVEFKSQFDIKHKYGPSRYDPILPKQKIKLGNIELAQFATDYENIFTWKLFCDNTEPKEGTVRPNDLIKLIK